MGEGARTIVKESSFRAGRYKWQTSEGKVYDYEYTIVEQEELVVRGKQDAGGGQHQAQVRTTGKPQIPGDHAPVPPGATLSLPERQNTIVPSPGGGEQAELPSPGGELAGLPTSPGAEQAELPSPAQPALHRETVRPPDETPTNDRYTTALVQHVSEQQLEQLVADSNLLFML